MFNSSQMGLAAGKTYFNAPNELHEMRLGCNHSTFKTDRAAKTGSQDNNISVILFGNNWIQGNLILIQIEALYKPNPSRQRRCTPMCHHGKMTTR